MSDTRSRESVPHVECLNPAEEEEASHSIGPHTPKSQYRRFCWLPYQDDQHDQAAMGESNYRN